MPDHPSIDLDRTHELVWFEALNEWFVRWHRGGAQQYSTQGWDSTLQATMAFESGTVTFQAEPPGHT